MSSENNIDVQFLEEHLQTNPDSILFARLAEAYLKANKVEDAIALCEDGLKKYPHYVTAHMILGKCYLVKKLYDQAEKEFKRVLLFDPKYLAAHKYYGDLMREIGWENTCELSYKKILQIDPLDEVAQSMVGDYMIEGGSTPEETEPFKTDYKEPEAGLGGVAPVTEEIEDEDLLFQGQDEPEAQTYLNTQGQEPEIDAKKAEEFSYILEDIFKDEIADEDAKKPPTPPTMETHEEEVSQENKSEPDSYLADLQFPEKREGHFDKDKEVEGPISEISELLEDVNGTGSQIKTSRPPSEAGREPSERPVRLQKSEGEKIVTPTLGEIYAAQGQYSKAIGVFETLLKKHPENETYLKKIEYLKQKLNESKNAPKN